MLGFIVQAVVTAIGLWVSARIVPGVEFTSTGSLVAAAVILALVNAFVRPVVTILTLPITIDEAVLGGKVEVPTLDGAVSMNLPRGATTGQKLRLKGKGIPRLNKSGRGDQYVTVSIQVPTNLSAEAKSALRAFDSAMKHKEAHKKGFFDKGKRK